MFVNLMPIFVAANISLNDTDWKYGPEVIYDGRFDGLSPVLDASGRTVTFNTTVKLACRPKSELIFICNFRKPTTLVTSWKAMGDSRVVEHSTEYLVEYPEMTVFEVDFNPNVERRLVVESSIDAPRLNFVRALIDQLNTVANWTSDAHQNLYIISDSIFGKCKSKYVKSTTKVGDEDAKKIEENVELSTIVLANGKPLEGDILEIQRIVDLDSCTPLYSSSQMGVDRTILSSESHIIVTKSNFTSYTDNVILFADGAAKSAGRERITLTLDKVVPAAGPLPIISDPLMFTLQATRVFHSDSGDVSFHPKLYNRWLTLIKDDITVDKSGMLETEDNPSQHMIV